MTFPSTVWNESGAGTHTAVLPGGSFKFEMTREDMPFRQICELALRNNPKRRFLFVSKVLGRHIPVRPALVVF